MSEIILHHYASSPYAEKARTLLGFKGLSWQSVDAASMMPKPDLIALTGGYRKIPVLQIGRDVYCDTRLIVHVLERLHPTPALLPNASKASCAAFALLEQPLFFTAVATGLLPEGVQTYIDGMGTENFQRFIQDRAVLFEGGTIGRPSPEFATARFAPLMGALDAQLAAQDGQPFLLGKEPTLADFVTYHPVWFVRQNRGVAHRLDPYPHLIAWSERIKAIGHGTKRDISSEEAIAIARASREQQPFEGAPLALHKAPIGTRVKVHATDYGVDPVEGTLVHASAIEVAIQRTDDRAGDVIVHFPRIDYKVTALSS